jgi:hypothetical protein
MFIAHFALTASDRALTSGVNVLLVTYLPCWALPEVAFRVQPGDKRGRAGYWVHGTLASNRCEIARSKRDQRCQALPIL